MKPFSGLILILSAFLPGTLLAETIGVRSGDHPGFTRLVVEFKGQEDWVFGRVDGGFELRPGREDVTYRLARVFDKIGRSRIEDVRDLGDGRLMLGVSCDCHGVVDVIPGVGIVLDIAEGPASAPGTGVDAALPPLGDQAARDAVAGGDTPEEQVPTERPSGPPAVVGDRGGLPLMFPRPDPFAPAAVPAAVTPPDPADASTDPEHAAMASGQGGAPEPQPLPPAAETSASAEADRAARIATTEAALLEQVARAAAQGLLDADMSALEENVADAKPEPAAPAAPPPVDPPPPPVTRRGHITVETSIDRAAAGPDRQGEDTDDGDACLSPALFDVSNWGEEVGNGADIGAYRSHLVTERDVADSAGVTALVRNYVYITFGAEAKALIRSYPDLVDRADVLFAMAEIMDDGWSTEAADLVGQMSCDGATALWATLAQPELRPGAAVNRDAVAMAFGALPAHLRRHLGPRLSDLFLASGDQETAEIIRAAIDRARDPENMRPTSEYGLLTAQFELEAGEVEQATVTLDEVVAAGDAQLPEALLQRVEATLGAGGAVPEDVVVLLDGLAFQFRGTDTARRMVDAGIRARASAGAFDAALEQLDQAIAAGLFRPERSAELRDGLHERLTRDADDTAFLRLSLLRLAEISGLSALPRRAAAQRFLDLGLPQAARAALGDSSAMPEPVDRQVLARAALLENRPAVAIGYLAGLEDAPALSLRAEALEMARDHPGALRAYEATGDRDKMVQMAWRGGLWPEAAALDAGPIGAAAQLMEGAPARPSGSVPDPDQPDTADPSGTETGATGLPGAGAPGLADLPALARAQALIDDSAAARKALSALLDELATPADAVAPEAVPGL